MRRRVIRSSARRRQSTDACVDSHALHPDDYIAVDAPTCGGGGCLPESAPCDETLPCCDGLECRQGTCQEPPPAGSIASISYGGSGCPQGSIGQSISSDRQSFTLIFDRFIASTGPSVPVTESRKSCLIDIDLTLPEGFAWSFTMDHRGYAQLASGVVAAQDATYYPAASFYESSFSGPTATDYLRTDELAEADFGPVSCAGGPLSLTVNTSVRIYDSSTSSSQLTTDSMDFKLNLVPCP